MRRSGSLPERLGVVLASCFVLLASTPATAGWHRVDTPNFVVLGEADAGSLLEVAVRFEAFRDTLSRLLSEQATATAVPTVVLVFPSDRAFAPFRPQHRGNAVALSGLFVPGADINYIAIVNGGDEAGRRLVFHEYAHLVFSNAARRLPVWLNEGLAEYYSTFELGRDGTQATIGRPIGDHLELLTRGPLFRLEALLQVEHGSPIYNEGERRPLFYAQSWALTHLLLHGEPRRADRLHVYLNRLWAGVPSRDAWRDTFGSEPLDRELVRYVNRSVFKAHRFTFHRKLAAFESTPAPLVGHDADAFLADFLLQQHRTDEAAHRMGTAVVTAPTPWSATVAALLDLARDQVAHAEQRLLTVDPGGDWLAAYRAGVALTRIVTESGRPPTDARVAAIRRLFASASSARGEMSHAAASLARVELELPDPPSRATRLAVEQASRTAPGRLDYVFLHARVLARQSAFAAARHLIAPLMVPGHSRDVRDAARQLMGDIVTVETGAERWADVQGQGDLCCPSARRADSAMWMSRELAADLSTHTPLPAAVHGTVCER
jgi:hypothetical protein